jgi:hypothetical protein
LRNTVFSAEEVREYEGLQPGEYAVVSISILAKESRPQTSQEFSSRSLRPKTSVRAPGWG